ncbi:MAG: type II secretion system secretin GspD [Acidobacteria bacterium]|nr:type II secretion system secretin GspD [Acidobacteriota bacterium]
MKKFIRLLGLLFIILVLIDNKAPSYAGVAQQQSQPQPAPGKKFVQGLFGLLEVDLSDPRPGVAFGPPLPQTTTPPAPVAAQPAPAAQAQADQVVPVVLNFDNTDIHPVVRIIGEILGINYVIDPTVRGTVNLNTAGQLQRSDLLPILEAILKMNGATMVRAGNFYQIVPANTAVRMPVEVQSARPGISPDDQIVLQVVRMKFVAAEEMARLLTPYMSEAGNIVAQGGLLLITDRRSNLRKLLEIVDEFDASAFHGERVRLLPVKNNRVRDVVEDLKTVFSGYALSTNTAIRFLPIERMNSVLVVTPNAEVFPEVERWLAQLDQPVQTAGARNFVYRVKNSKASDLQRVLLELYGGAQPTNGTGSFQTAAGEPAPAGVPAAPPPAAGGASRSPAEASVGTWVNPGQLRIIADVVNNALVVQATSQDYQQILRTLEELDVLPRQVLIDAQVYEVALDHSLSLGLSAKLQSRSTLNPAQTTAAFDTSGPGPAGFSATTFAFIGRTRELLAFLNASENRSRVRTLSAPSILVSNNSTARVQIGTEVPIPGASSFTPLGGTNQTIQFRDTGVLLNVTPQINDGGNITLTISQEVSQAGVNTTSAIVAPVIGKSSVTSTIVARTGDTVALTGFIRENDDLGRNRVPLLGSIPGVGLLFGNTRKSTSRTELIILITPHVITSAEESSAATNELKARLKEVRSLLN